MLEDLLLLPNLFLSLSSVRDSDSASAHRRGEMPCFVLFNIPYTQASKSGDLLLELLKNAPGHVEPAELLSSSSLSTPSRPLSETIGSEGSEAGSYQGPRSGYCAEIII